MRKSLLPWSSVSGPRDARRRCIALSAYCITSFAHLCIVIASVIFERNASRPVLGSSRFLLMFHVANGLGLHDSFSITPSFAAGPVVTALSRVSLIRAAVLFPIKCRRGRTGNLWCDCHRSDPGATGPPLWSSSQSLISARRERAVLHLTTPPAHR
ncbi:hypothetical protein BD413DRAFT_176331 [Trametes elegans]|nr:hypothetical protein BD413DRAFT_176331 [Trametes elegans]